MISFKSEKAFLHLKCQQIHILSIIQQIICWIQMINKYSDNAPEMCRWREATERGAGFLRVTVESEGTQTRRPGYCSLWEVLGCQTEKARRHCSRQQQPKGFSSPKWACWLCPSRSSETRGASLSSEADVASISKSSGQTHPCRLTQYLESCVYFADNCRFAWNARFITYLRETVLWAIALISR